MLSAFHAKVYCGAKDVPPGNRKFGTPAQCKALKMLRRYGNITVLHPITAAKKGATICTGSKDYKGRRIVIGPRGGVFVYKYDRDGTCRGRKRLYKQATKVKCMPIQAYIDYINRFKALSSDPEALKGVMNAANNGQSLFTPVPDPSGYMAPEAGDLHPGLTGFQGRTTGEFNACPMGCAPGCNCPRCKGFRGPASDPEALQGVKDAAFGDHTYGDQTLLTPPIDANDYEIPPPIHPELGAFHGPASDPHALQDVMDDQPFPTPPQGAFDYQIPQQIHSGLGALHA